MRAQVIELYSENGLDRPFFATFATPFSGNVVRVLNTGPMEYPLTASVVRPRLAISASRIWAGTQERWSKRLEMILFADCVRCGQHAGESLLEYRLGAALPAEEPPLPIGTGAGLKASGGWVAIRLTSGARLGRREVPLQEWCPLHLVLLPSLR